jgi:methyltransferase (TIGR00027 family)
LRKGKTSLTAEFVSAWRGLAGLGKDSFAPDPIAKRLVSAPVRTLLERAEQSPRAARALNAFLDSASLGVWRHLPLRTRAIDDAVTREVNSGTRQIVLLGAGLDARAHRLEVLAECTLYEIDHPSTQATKMQNARNLPQIAREIHYVAVDFETDDVAAALLKAGLDPDAKSIFIWEGVTMYLPRAAIEATLSKVARVTATGSVLLATYYDVSAEARTRFARPFFSIVGEPLRSSFSKNDIRELFSAHDFEIESDEGDDDWGERYAGKKPIFDMSERLVLARRI